MEGPSIELKCWLYGFNRQHRIPIGTFLLAVNVVIFNIVAFVFSLEKAMLSLALYYIVAKMINYVLDGFNHGKSAMIITEKQDEIGERIIKELNMSISYLYGEGGFLSKKKKIIDCITNPFIYSKLKRVILSVDPNAIMEASCVCETSGLDSPLITPKASTHKEYCSQ